MDPINELNVAIVRERRRKGVEMLLNLCPESNDLWKNFEGHRVNVFVFVFQEASEALESREEQWKEINQSAGILLREEQVVDRGGVLRLSQE
jgi:hypothetical protein